MNNYNIYLTVIILVKVLKIEYWKERLEFVFVALMSILFIYLFNPRTGTSILIESETKLLLYLFGIFLLITAKWSEFFKESKMFKRIQTALGKP